MSMAEGLRTSLTSTMTAIRSCSAIRFTAAAIPKPGIYRGTNVRRALIGDPRNDENALVSQLQDLFLRFHNRIFEVDPVCETVGAAR